MADPGGRSMEVDMERDGELFRLLGSPVDAMGEHASANTVAMEEAELMWAAVESLPSVRQRHFAVVRTEALTDAAHSPAPGFDLVDVRKMDQHAREKVLTKAFATAGQDNYNILAGIKERFDRVGLEVPKVEVTFENLTISAKVQTGSRALPTLPNYALNALEALLTSCMLLQPNRKNLTILDNVSGILKPGRMTLLLGPPGSGKTTLLLALAGKLDGSLKKIGDVKYNGCELHKFIVQRTSAYISQTDNHIGDLTVRETLDFGARCQGASNSWAENLKELMKLEKEKSIHPSPEIDAFMKVASVGGEHSLITDYTLKVLGLDVCAHTLVGSDMVRGVSGGQKKRVTSGEMIVGPRKTLFMDEISTGLDSSTTYQIVKCMQNFVHQMDATLLMSLLQPAPETFDLFDDLILLSEGHIVYQGPIDKVLVFFQSLGFSLPARKGVADFLQEVTSRNDQEQYWSDKSKPYVFVPTSAIAQAFKESEYGRSVQSILLTCKDGRVYHPKALAKTNYAISNWNLLKACFSRELLLISRHRFLYIFRTSQVTFVGLFTCTIFFRSRLQPGDEISGGLYLSCLFFGLVHLMFNGFSELPITISRLPVFFKQRDCHFYPAWAFSLPSWLLRIPYSVIEAVVWSCVVYYTVGFAPSAGRFFRFMLLLFSIHQMALGLFRMIASLARSYVVANTFGSAALMLVFLLGGFIVPKDRIKPWWVWASWVSPLTYGQRAISINEFGDPRWSQMDARGDMTVGESILVSQGLPTQDYWYWIGIGVLLTYSVLFNIVFILSLKYLNPRVKAQAVVASDSEEKKDGGGSQVKQPEPTTTAKGTSGGKPSKKGMCLPFQRLVMTFHNVNYFVDIPKEIKQKGVPETRLQLLTGVNGVFKPGVLTALVGSSGAGKTTLMDVLAGRKTGGYIEGEIKISGFVKDQRTFARVTGYVEQNDIHSPQVTVEESLWFSSSLRLPREVSPADRRAFVEEVMSLVELEPLRQALVGLPGSTGLSTEQRKRLTIAVELVANPSIIFMDEPTSGLDARAAAIVMRTVRNTVDTGRTVVCTIHQPSIDIFEAFDELLLMKRGGQVIYGGTLGENSQDMIDYFQSIEGVTPIPNDYNPATWMLEVSTPASEEKLGTDFATVYKNSDQFRRVEALIKELSVPADGTHALKFDTQFSQDKLSQFKVCCRKQFLVYWRSPEYNIVRLFFTALAALIVGSVFWDVGTKMDTTQDLTIVLGALYSSCLFVGVNNAASVQPLIAMERTVYYRERATRMYASLPYAAAQGLVEIPYLVAQAIIFGVITFFMINYERTAVKFFLYLLFMFLSLMYFTFYGMMAIALTPSQHLAAIISSAFYSLWNLLSGFLIPKPFIPAWWVWFYHICPVAWTLRGIFTSQLGDVDSIVVGPGFEGSVKLYIEKSLGYDSGMTGVSAVVLLAFSVLFFSVYAVSIKMINFQRR